MKRILGIVALVLFVGAPVFAADPAIQYTLQLGGNNGAPWAGGTPPIFDTTNVKEAPTVSSVSGGVITWSVRVTVTGEKLNTADGVMYPVGGAANLVWDLKLIDPDGNLVANFGLGSATTGGFFSTIQDGSDRGGTLYSVETAAFPWVFNVNGSGDTGRIFDTPYNNGVGMVRYTYPNTLNFKTGSTAPGGTLMGMGAGYTSFDPLAVDEHGVALERGGVGIFDPAISNSCFTQDLGNLPIAEGQINTTGLPKNGIYTLQLVPGKGNNVLWWPQITCMAIVPNTGSFAIGVDPANVGGSSIQFDYQGAIPCVPPTFASAMSVSNHTGVGPLGIPLATTGNATVEPRSGGPAAIVLAYSKPIGGTAAVTLSAGTAGAATIVGNLLTVPISGVPDKTCLTITVDGIKDAADATCSAAAVTLKVVCRKGDVNGDQYVNTTDMNVVRGKSSSVPVTAANCMYDVNGDGFVNTTDMNTIRGLSSSVQSPACSN